MTTTNSYDDLVAEATRADFSGWDFSWMAGRAEQPGPSSWEYADRAAELVADAQSVLDLDTGGGEALARLAPLPPHAVATESWEPNIDVARQRLAPLGCEVRRPESEDRLPADDDEFDLVLCRHGGLPAGELARVLRPGGVFFTQQVGSRNCVDLNEALGAPPPPKDTYAWTLDKASTALTDAGFSITWSSEEFPEFTFRDVGAMIYHLRAVSWQIPDFDVRTYDTALRAMHDRIRSEGGFTAHDHRFAIEARLTA